MSWSHTHSNKSRLFILPLLFQPNVARFDLWLVCRLIYHLNHKFKFSTTYLCESGFSTWVLLRVKQRNRLDTDLRVALSTIPPDCETYQEKSTSPTISSASHYIINISSASHYIINISSASHLIFARLLSFCTTAVFISLCTILFALCCCNTAHFPTVWLIKDYLILS